jgi:hypothetical protein
MTSMSGAVGRRSELFVNRRVGSPSEGVFCNRRTFPDSGSRLPTKSRLAVSQTARSAARSMGAISAPLRARPARSPLHRFDIPLRDSCNAYTNSLKPSTPPDYFRGRGRLNPSMRFTSVRRETPSSLAARV